MRARDASKVMTRRIKVRIRRIVRRGYPNQVGWLVLWISSFRRDDFSCELLSIVGLLFWSEVGS